MLKEKMDVKQEIKEIQKILVDANKDFTKAMAKVWEKLDKIKKS